jgi:glycosyltransferase involved in cell wall biosynthesis
MRTKDSSVSLGRKVARRLQTEWRDRRRVTLRPSGGSRGRVLLSYLIEPFLVDWSKLPPTDPIHWHSNAWECRDIAQTFLELGYTVDAISGTNRAFKPLSDYAAFIDTRHNMERLAPRVGADCLKIFHVDCANTVFQNMAEHQRLLGIQERRGATLLARRLELPNRGIEVADCATVLGNRFTLDTFRYAHKPMFPIPLSSNLDIRWPEGKDFDACRRKFLWIGSRGLVRKGLDIILEAFAELPDFELFVCGAIGSVGARSREGAELVLERDFENEYRRELYELPNIHTLGWMDTRSAEFEALARQCLGMAYASCCEGQCGGVISCMHAGLIPVISYESGVDVHDHGFLFDSCSVADVKRKLLEVAGLPAGELEARARRTWEYARRVHTRENFSRVFRQTVQALLEPGGRASRASDGTGPVRTSRVERVALDPRTSGHG